MILDAGSLEPLALRGRKIRGLVRESGTGPFWEGDLRFSARESRARRR
jgi:hypothetical protein